MIIFIAAADEPFSRRCRFHDDAADYAMMIRLRHAA
jgi:hypothetical protein